jgi:hypothetical protein
MSGPDPKYFHESFEKLRDYIERENFRGYDPYDTLNSQFPFSKFGHTFSILALQFQKRNPLNIRPLLSINKETNNMGLGLMLKAYCGLQKNFPERNYQSQISLLFKLLSEGASKRSKYTCWGYNFDWPTSSKFIAKDTPNAVVTAFAVSGVFEYYSLHRDPKAAELIASASEFVLNELKITEFPEGICFSYTPLEADCCYNASLLATLILAQQYSIQPEKDLLEKINTAVNFVLSKQHGDGKWNYSLDKASEKEREQVDFHQGFILDCLGEIRLLTGQKSEAVDQAIVRGLEFYYSEQFLANGRSLWRLPKEFPVDIHNQSQGIITFLKFAELKREYLSFAETIAEWTVKNMQHETGYFYYRQYPFYKIKISYMRWAQANMFYALSQLMIHLRKHA